MKWTVWIIALVACLVCGLLGLTAGININPASTVKYVPNWGSLGDWVSGVGALLAVISSLVMVRRNEVAQMEREREQFKVSQSVNMFYLTVHVVSQGYLPCTVKSVMLESPSKQGVPLHHYLPAEGRLTIPQKLQHRDDLQYSWRYDQLEPLLHALSWMRLFSVDDLSILVVTSVGEYRTPITSEFASSLLGIARGARIELIENNDPA